MMVRLIDSLSFQIANWNFNGNWGVSEELISATLQLFCLRVLSRLVHGAVDAVDACCCQLPPTRSPESPPPLVWGVDMCTVSSTIQTDTNNL
jgi:hypothetical protein